MIDIPHNNDNRRYDYSQYTDMERTEYADIIALVAPNARVIDLGCGNGALLSRMIAHKHITGVGIELSPSGVEVCRKRGLDARIGKIDEPLSFRENEFDYAVCNVTIQMVLYPEMLLKEMKRIARYQIVSFPNFAFWRNRLELLLHGRMPATMLFGYSWYSTGHIHQLSFSDFSALLDDVGDLRIVEQRLERSKNPLKNLLMQKYPNMFQMLGIYLLEKIEQ